MESHESDPKAETETDPWEGVNDELGALGRRLKETYGKVAREGGPTEDEIRQAFVTLAGAWDQVAESVTLALDDDDVRHHLRQAASSLATALGATITEMGKELGEPPNGPRSEEE